MRRSQLDVYSAEIFRIQKGDVENSETHRGHWLLPGWRNGGRRCSCSYYREYFSFFFLSFSQRWIEREDRQSVAAAQGGASTVTQAGLRRSPCEAVQTLPPCKAAASTWSGLPRTRFHCCNSSLLTGPPKFFFGCSNYTHGVENLLAQGGLLCGFTAADNSIIIFREQQQEEKKLFRFILFLFFFFFDCSF